MREFCDYLKEIDTKCSTCREDGVAACQIKLGDQEYYKGFELCDTITILRSNHALSVETDIEVKYRTDYPYGRFAGKAAEFATESADKGKRLIDFLQPKLPPGVRLLRHHLHYNPDKLDPNIVALHIHAHKRVEDLDEAKHLASSLAEIIKPSQIETELAKE